MAYTTINKSSEHFNTKLYTGNGSAGHAITGVGFQPDLVWIKNRSGTYWGNLTDSVRGVNKVLYSARNSAEATTSNYLSSFNTDGFTVTIDNDVNGNGNSIVAWNWKANGAGSANTDGNITSTVSVNTTSGFSIVKYSGNSGGNGYSATIGHGLGVAPSMVIVKCLTNSDGWFTYHKGNTSAPQTDFVRLDNTDATADLAGMWYDTAPTNSVFTVGTDGGVNQVGRDYIAYCFAEKTGFSKIGSYIGSGSSNGSFIYTGFKPAFYMIKRTDTTGSWIIKDTKRPGYNVNGTYLVNDTDIAEATGSGNLATDELSNGFKMRGTSSAINTDNGTYIYLAFAEAPLVGTNNVPCTAR